MTILLAIGAYFLGATPFSLLFSRLFDLPDPRIYGSGNLGASNVMRSGNKTAAALTLFADISKGIIPVAIAHAVNLSAIAIVAVGITAIIGHVFSVFMRFRGGKGVATTLGVFLAWDIQTGVAICLLWLSVFLLCRISSLSSLVAIVAAPFLLWYLASPPLAFGGGGITFLIVFTHRNNVKNLLWGKERKFGRNR